jgi:hypothetical protein
MILECLIHSNKTNKIIFQMILKKNKIFFDSANMTIIYNIFMIIFQIKNYFYLKCNLALIIMNIINIIMNKSKYLKSKLK